MAIWGKAWPMDHWYTRLLVSLYTMKSKFIPVLVKSTVCWLTLVIVSVTLMGSPIS